MKSLSRDTKVGIAIIALGWLAVFVAVTLLRPLMPIDEARYLTVAWEMMVRHNWILPTVNYEPYSHKPPLLFWAICGLWKIFGIGLMPARLAIFAAVGAFLFLTARLAHSLYKDNASAVTAALLMAAMPVYLTYGSVIMFDSFLAVFVMIAMIAIWRAGQKEDFKNWILLGLAIGFGLLTKGPVVFLYTLPPALLAPFWIQNRIVTWRAWYGGLFMAVAIGAFIGLAWSLQAAEAGGSQYARKIFLTQSAGRVVDAFDHKEPFWFYVPVLAAFLLPILSFTAVWASARTCFRMDEPTKFLLCWALPAFLFFSAISSKSIHYVIPYLPAFAILAAGLLRSVHFESAKPIRLPIFLMVVPSLVATIAVLLGKKIDDIPLASYSVYIALAHIALSIVIYLWVRKEPMRSLRGLTLASFLLVLIIHGHGYELMRRYDLAPLANEMKKYEGRAWGMGPKYDGDYGYAFRTQNLFIQVGREEIDWWFKANPKGLYIGRYKEGTVPDFYKVLYEQPFRKNEVIAVIEILPWTPEISERWRKLQEQRKLDAQK